MEPSSADFCAAMAAASAARPGGRPLNERRAGYDKLMKMMFKGRSRSECTATPVVSVPNPPIILVLDCLQVTSRGVRRSLSCNARAGERTVHITVV